MITVSVKFDPCALNNHKPVKAKTGLAGLIGLVYCECCGEALPPSETITVGGIDFEKKDWWES
jgi:hypothetical protein